MALPLLMRETDRSYLLRIWRDGKGEDAWRASLRELASGEVKRFRSLEALLEFLQRSPGAIVREDPAALRDGEGMAAAPDWDATDNGA